MIKTLTRPRNDPRQYDDLAEAWWAPRGPFAMLSWIARARAELVPPAERPGAVLVDLACGGGLLAPHVADKGYRHVGVDITASALAMARSHGVLAVEGDVRAVPLRDGSADVVCAGEILEHVAELETTLRNAVALLRPGGVLVIDTIAQTALARLLVVTLAERLPGAAPPGIHDPQLFVDRRELVAICARLGVRLELRGLRPAFGQLLAWSLGAGREVAMQPTRSTAVLFQGIGRKPR